MNNKFLDKVCDQIISETMVKDDLLHTPFRPYLFSPALFHVSFFPSSYPFPSFISHCKEVYSLNEQELKYVWVKYKEGLTTLMDKKELSYEY